MTIEQILEKKNHQGAKGPIFFGENKILVYQRDHNTDYYPGYYDFPGGGREGDETVLQTFTREVHEEFDLNIGPKNIVYAKQYPSTRFHGSIVYFLVARLPETASVKIKLGDEGSRYMLMTAQGFLNHKKSLPFLRSRLKKYLVETQNKG